MAKTVKSAAVKSEVAPEVVVQRHLGLEAVELSPEMQKKSEVGYAYGKANFCKKPVHYAGNLDILTEKRFITIGLSDGAKPEAINIAKRAAASVGQRGFANIIIGGTRKIDMNIIREAIANGSRVAALLPMGIKAYADKFISDEVKQLISDGNLILVSQFPASRGWDMQTAQLRNVLISKACTSIFIADCRGEKGVWGLAENFRDEKKDIYVPALTKDSRMEHYGLVGAMGAIELPNEPVELSDGEDIDIYNVITRI
jgi:hypothetical protein